MLRKDIPTVEVSIDERYSDGEDLGIDLISNVKTPAVKIKGAAFKTHLSTKDANLHPNCRCKVVNGIIKSEIDACDYCQSLDGQEYLEFSAVKTISFTDTKKYRIAAPALVPDDIYRNDEDGEYFIRFTKEKIEQLAKKFMLQLPSKGNRVFNLEHGDELIDSYILEAILADDDAKVEMIKKSYGVDVPQGTFFIVQQFNNVEKFNELVSKGQIGFSIEGYLGMELIDNNKIKQSKMKENSKLTKMKRKQKFVGVKRTFKSASKRRLEEVLQNDELIVIVDELVEGAEAVVVEDVTAGPIEDFSGEVDIVVDGVEETVIIESGVITEIVVEETTEEVTMEDEKKEEEVVMETEEVKEEEVEMEDLPTVNYDQKFDEVYAMIAELKNEILALKTPAVEEEVVMKKNFTSALVTFNQKFGDK
jgi:hypothetical protein